MGSGSFMKEIDEMLDVQAVDIGIVSHILTGEKQYRPKTIGSFSGGE